MNKLILVCLSLVALVAAAPSTGGGYNGNQGNSCLCGNSGNDNDDSENDCNESTNNSDGYSNDSNNSDDDSNNSGDDSDNGSNSAAAGVVAAGSDARVLEQTYTNGNESITLTKASVDEGAVAGAGMSQST